MKYDLFKRAMPLIVLALGLQSGQAWSAGLPTGGCTLKTLQGKYTWDEATRTDYSSYGYTKFGAGWVFAVSVGREVNDGRGNITSGQMTINNTYDGVVRTEKYFGKVTVNPDCTGKYSITLEDGVTSGGGGTIYIDPVSRNFTLLDEYNIGTAKFVRDGN